MFEIQVWTGTRWIKCASENLMVNAVYTLDELSGMDPDHLYRVTKDGQEVMIVLSC